MINIIFYYCEKKKRSAGWWTKLGESIANTTHREILLNQTEIRLYLTCTDWFPIEKSIQDNILLVYQIQTINIFNENYIKIPIS